MNWLDFAVGALILAGFASGWRRGALMQVFSWGGFVIGLGIGGLTAPRIVRLIEPATPLARAMLAVGIFLGIAFLVEALLAVAGSKVRRRIVGAVAANVDAVLGSVVAASLALTASWFLGITFKDGPSGDLASAIRGSAILRFTDSIAPRPPRLFAEIGRFLNATGFPEVFADLNPSLAPGVAPPPAELADEPLILAAAELTYKIESRGCGGMVDGSGFPVGGNLVFTAAHVLAGTQDHRVLPAEGSRSWPATPIYLDDRKDIAILRVEGLPEDRLLIRSEEAARGTDGAAIGYPGGGPRTISPGRVRAKSNALGRDIYSRNLVEREIYVLHSQVRRGNSGGPFVDTDGQVRGMIFAAASDDPNEAYALSERELLGALEAARERTAAVGTGACAI